jgi:hypothetical protein
MRTHRSVVIIVAVASLSAGPRRANADDLSQVSDAYTVTSWGYKDGLPSGGVHGLAQDRDGYLWLGTNSGLLRFDGISFVSWDSLGRAPLPRRQIRHLLQDRDGSLWLGFAGPGGVVHIQNGHLEQYGASEGLQDGDVTALLQDVDGVIWAATVQGLFRLTGTRWKRVGQPDGIPDGAIFSALADRQGRLFVGTASAVLMRAERGGRFKLVHTADDRVMGLAEDGAGALYITDPTSGVNARARPRSGTPSAAADTCCCATATAASGPARWDRGCGASRPMPHRRIARRPTKAATSRSSATGCSAFSKTAPATSGRAPTRD